MGIRSAFNAGAQAIFAAFGGSGGIAESITYRAVAVGAYNTTTGLRETTNTDTTVDDAIIVQFSARELQGGTFAGSASTDIRPTDAKLLLNASAYTIAPSLTDKVVRADSTVWNVANFRAEPSGSLCTIQIRKP